MSPRAPILVVLAIVGALLLAPVAQASPPNDDFADAQVVGPELPLSVPASNVGATAEEGEEPHFSVNPVVHSVWFRWTAGSSGTVVIDTCARGGGIVGASSYNLAVYTGGSLGSLTTVAAHGGNDCLIRFAATGGTEYRIAVDFFQTEGSFDLKLRELAPPANDDYAGACRQNYRTPLFPRKPHVEARTDHRAVRGSSHHARGGSRTVPAEPCPDGRDGLAVLA